MSSTGPSEKQQVQGKTVSSSDSAGHVAFRRRKDAASTGSISQVSFISTPARLDSRRMPARRRHAPHNSRVSTDNTPDSQYGTENGIPEEDSSFSAWMTSGLFGALNTAAGVTLSTTGQLMGPPMQVTKSVLLPGILALLVDTLDKNTSPRVQDWFRILSTSVNHLILVLSSTERGQEFSSQLYTVLQDFLIAVSAPEARQVLVDGMATCVKFADALHTPEVKSWLEQWSVLSVRLVDAASSGKSKQLMQDSRDLAWKGIEMATDPAMTLALAEVTAHICHALEDTQQTLNPPPRAQRNTKNQSTYLNPYQMSSDYPEQVSMEEIILSSLGARENDRVEDDDAASIPSKVAFDEERRDAEPSTEHDWKDRAQQVDVQLLKDGIMQNRSQEARKIPVSSVESSGTSSVASGDMAQEPESRDVDEQTDTERQGPALDEDKADIPTAHVKDSVQDQANNKALNTDMEDIALSGVQNEPRRKAQPKPGRDIVIPPNETQTVVQFYQKLDELVKDNRTRLRERQIEAVSEPDQPQSENKDDAPDPWKTLRASIKKLGETHEERKKTVRTEAKRRAANFKPQPAKRKGMMLVAGAVLASASILFTGFAFYGMYTLFRGSSGGSPAMSRQLSGVSGSQEVVIRLVREVVHVASDGTVIGRGAEGMSQDEIKKITEQVAAAFQ